NPQRQRQIGCHLEGKKESAGIFHRCFVLSGHVDQSPIGAGYDRWRAFSLGSPASLKCLYASGDGLRHVAPRPCAFFRAGGLGVSTHSSTAAHESCGGDQDLRATAAGAGEETAAAPARSDDSSHAAAAIAPAG